MNPASRVINKHAKLPAKAKLPVCRVARVRPVLMQSRWLAAFSHCYVLQVVASTCQFYSKVTQALWVRIHQI